MTLHSIRRKPVRGRHYSGPQPYRKGWPQFRLNDVSAAAKIKGSVTVAIVDSGVPNDDTSPNRDDDGHATLLDAAIRSIDKYPDLTLRIDHIKFFSAQGWPKPDRAADAIEEAAKRQPDVIVLAWDTGHDTPQLRSSIEALGDKCLVVIAAGNWSLDNDKYPNWPASYCGQAGMEHVITVMATNEDDERASYSSYGESSVYIAAPGLAIVESPSSESVLRKAGSLRESYSEFRGTSAAAAHVARLAALLKAKHPDWKPQDVKRHIRDNGRNIADDLRRRPAGRQCCQTNCIVDFDSALA